MNIVGFTREFLGAPFLFHGDVDYTVKGIYRNPQSMKPSKQFSSRIIEDHTIMTTYTDQVKKGHKVKVNDSWFKVDKTVRDGNGGMEVRLKPDITQDPTYSNRGRSY